MPSTNTPSTTSSDDAVKGEATGNSSATAKAGCSQGVRRDAHVIAADGPDKQRVYATGEQRLLDEVLDRITTFGPLDGAVKIKIPESNKYILVHGQLLIEKSYYCRGALARTKKEKEKQKELTLPLPSATTLAYFLKWIYDKTVLPNGGAPPECHAERKVAWPDLVNLWFFANGIDLPGLQNHAVEVLVRKMHSFLKFDDRPEGEIDLIRAAFNLIWRGKNQAQSETAQRERAEQPLRALMMDWFANPLYQTKSDADQLWAGGLSRGFYRNYALHTVGKNFSVGNHGLDDKDDAQALLKSMEDVSQHTLGRLWYIEPEKYYVEQD